MSKDKSSKLWSNAGNIDKMIEEFTVGTDTSIDLLLAPSDVIGTIAHGTMLENIGLLKKDEWISLKNRLRTIYQQACDNQLRIDAGIEDIHSQIELMLTDELGDAAKKIHTGRSRNDQVLLDIRLFSRDQLRVILHEVKLLFHALLELSDTYKGELLPGYTHLQIAMPSSFGLWFGAYAESLLDDVIQLQATWQIVNKNPLGSAAGYGSSFPLDRQLTTDLLGFDSMNFNSIYAQMGRGRTERIVAQTLAGFADTLGRMAMDIVLYLSQNFGFIQFPENITTGSSIMPHKKNPDVFELIRAKCNQIKNLPQLVNGVYSNLPSGYHRDFQIIKEPYLFGFEQLIQCLQVLNLVLPKVEVKKGLLKEQKYRDVFSVEMVNEKVQKGMPFREAYHQVAQEIRNQGVSKPQGISYTHEGSIGNLQNPAIEKAMKEVCASFDFEKIDKAYKKLLS